MRHPLVNDPYTQANLQVGQVYMAKRSPNVLGQINITKVSPYCNIIHANTISYITTSSYRLLDSTTMNKST